MGPGLSGAWRTHLAHLGLGGAACLEELRETFDGGHRDGTVDGPTRRDTLEDLDEDASFTKIKNSFLKGMQGTQNTRKILVRFSEVFAQGFVN